jgi:DNA-binding response OmpR family regulator
MESTAAGSGHRTLTALVVDDEPAVVAVVARIARECGFEVREATSSAQAEELAAKAPMDLIIADVAMPHLRGPELIGRLREKGHRCPVLFLSGESDLATIDSSLSMDQAMFMPKPFTRNELVDAIWATMKL